MNKKQKKTLYRILAVLAAFIILLILEHTGVLERLHPVLVFVLYFILLSFMRGRIAHIINKVIHGNHPKLFLWIQPEHYYLIK